MTNTPQPLFVIVDEDVRRCFCCHRSHMKKTFYVADEDGKIDSINLGVTCAGKWFGGNYSGNIYKSADRLQRRIANMSVQELFDTLEKIRLANEQVK